MPIGRTFDCAVHSPPKRPSGVLFVERSDHDSPDMLIGLFLIWLGRHGTGALRDLLLHPRRFNEPLIG